MPAFQFPHRETARTEAKWSIQSVQPTGQGTLELQVSWFNTVTSAWELLYDDPNAPPSTMIVVSKGSQQCYNDSYQLKAVLTGANVISTEQTFTPSYLYPGVINDTVAILDPQTPM